MERWVMLRKGRILIRFPGLFWNQQETSESDTEPNIQGEAGNREIFEWDIVRYI